MRPRDSTLQVVDLGPVVEVPVDDDRTPGAQRPPGRASDHDVAPEKARLGDAALSPPLEPGALEDLVDREVEPAERLRQASRDRRLPDPERSSDDDVEGARSRGTRGSERARPHAIDPGTATVRVPSGPSRARPPSGRPRRRAPPGSTARASPRSGGRGRGGRATSCRPGSRNRGRRGARAPGRA